MQVEIGMYMTEIVVICIDKGSVGNKSSKIEMDCTCD